MAHGFVAISFEHLLLFHALDDSVIRSFELSVFDIFGFALSLSGNFDPAAVHFYFYAFLPIVLLVILPAKRFEPFVYLTYHWLLFFLRDISEFGSLADIAFGKFVFDFLHNACPGSCRRGVILLYFFLSRLLSVFKFAHLEGDADSADGNFPELVVGVE